MKEKKFKLDGVWHGLCKDKRDIPYILLGGGNIGITTIKAGKEASGIAFIIKDTPFKQDLGTKGKLDYEVGVDFKIMSTSKESLHTLRDKITEAIELLKG